MRDNFLRKIAPKVSTIGTANNKIGKANVMIVELLKPNKEIADMIKPKNNAPQSPIRCLRCEL